MAAHTIVLTATGTDVGKTHLGVALLLCAPPSHRVCAWKPYESGVESGVPSDSERLAEATQRGPATSRLEPPLGRWSLPLAPLVAARRTGARLEAAPLMRRLGELREQEDLLLLELAGGLYAPLCEGTSCLDIVQSVPDAKVVLLAPNRLGVLHDVLATVRAATADGVRVACIVLSASERTDPSTSDNADLLRESLARSGVAPLVYELPRAPASELAAGPLLHGLWTHLLPPAITTG